MKKVLRETQTLRAKNFRHAVDPFPGAQDRQNLISWRWSLPAQTEFGEDRCTQFPVIVVTDTARPPARPPATNRTDNNTLRRYA